MKIQWNKVTWYSKLAAIVVFVGTFAIAFHLGAAWEWAAIQTAVTTAPVATTTPAATGGGAGAHCGGFIKDAPTCAAGFHCQLAVGRPDTGGTCVADQVTGGGGILPYHSGVRGTVTLGPTCPVERMPPDPACADKKYATMVSVFRQGSSSVFATTESDANGAFEFSLPPGSYTVSAAVGAMLPRCSSVDVTVGPSDYATAAISCDTGIR